MSGRPINRTLRGHRPLPENRVLALQQVVHDDGGQEPERAEKQDHRAILREPAPAVGMISTDALADLAPCASGAIVAHVATGRAEAAGHGHAPGPTEAPCREAVPNVSSGRSRKSVSTGWCRGDRLWQCGATRGRHVGDDPDVSGRARGVSGALPVAQAPGTGDRDASGNAAGLCPLADPCRASGRFSR